MCQWIKTPKLIVFPKSSVVPSNFIVTEFKSVQKIRKSTEKTSLDETTSANENSCKCQFCQIRPLVFCFYHLPFPTFSQAMDDIDEYGDKLKGTIWAASRWIHMLIGLQCSL
nr:hypothetical protein Itr_chr04CG05920 [Ipomoea trifida]